MPIEPQQSALIVRLDAMRSKLSLRSPLGDDMGRLLVPDWTLQTLLTRSDYSTWKVASTRAASLPHVAIRIVVHL